MTLYRLLSTIQKFSCTVFRCPWASRDPHLHHVVARRYRLIAGVEHQLSSANKKCGLGPTDGPYKIYLWPVHVSPLRIRHLTFIQGVNSNMTTWFHFLLRFFNLCTVNDGAVRESKTLQCWEYSPFDIFGASMMIHEMRMHEPKWIKLLCLNRVPSVKSFKNTLKSCRFIILWSEKGNPLQQRNRSFCFLTQLVPGWYTKLIYMKQDGLNFTTWKQLPTEQKLKSSPQNSCVPSFYEIKMGIYDNNVHNRVVVHNRTKLNGTKDIWK